MREVCIDQFDVKSKQGPLHIYAYETFEPKGDLYYVWTFKAANAKGKVVGTVQLESSAAIRELGDKKYVMGVSLPGGTHKTTGPWFETLPSYPKVREVARELLRTRLTAP